MNRFLTLIFFAVAVSVSGQAPDFIPSDGLLGLWPLNGSAGDLTGNYVNSSVVGGDFTDDRLGNANSALMLNGTDEYVVIDGPIEVEDFTIALWFLAEQEQYTVQTEVYPLVYVGMDSGISPDCNGFGTALTSTEIVALFGCVSAPFGSSTPTPAVYGSWIHLALSFSSLEGTVTYFVNGEQFGTRELNNTFLPPSPNIFFGAVDFTSYSKFHGALDEIGLWNRALSNEEVQQLFLSSPTIQGCIIPEACNYNPAASFDDGSCIHPPDIDLGDDIETCEDSVMLDAGPGFNSYLWSTGDTTQTLSVLESGEISVQGTQDIQFSLDFTGEEQNITISEIPEYEAESHTVSVWCKPAGFSNYDLVSKDDEANNRQWLLQITNQGRFQGHVWTGDDDLTEIQSPTVMESGQWYYLTQTWDGELFKTYINGNLEGVKVTQGPLQTGDHPITIGGDDLAPNFWTNGLLDDVEIWDIALNEEAIQSFMMCGPEGDEDGLVGLWRFNEGEGSSVYDMSIHGNHGDVNGIQWSNDIPETICTGQCSSSATIAVNILGQGCTAPEACNYNPTASCDDGSCIYPPVIDLGDDIETCEDSIMLDAGPGFDSYLWSTGDTSQVILAESSGTYLVDAEVLSDWTWVTGEPLLLDYWTSDQSTLNGGCAEMYSSDGFHIAPCNEQKHFVMEIDGLAIEEESFSLPEIEGFTYIDPSFMNDCNAGLNQVLTSAYFMSDVEATFGEAQQISESQGGHLVAISSPYENDFVANIDGCLFGCGNNCEGFWIGLERMICAAQDSISVVFEMKGCTDPDACNFDEEAVCDDGNCATCEALQEACGPGTSWDSEISQCVIEEQGACGPGTIWNPETSQCVIEESCGWNPDSDDDSLVGVSDLLMFLSVFGSEWPVFNCGDLVLHQGYEYETVQIGEQCWFAENLNNSSAGGGDIIEIQSHDDWLSNYELGMPGFCYPDFSEEHAQQYGKLYNIHAILSSDLCPNNWHVSTDEDWFVLEMFLGLPLEALTSEARLAYDIGYDLKDDAVWNGNNSSGFGAVPAGEKSGYDFPFSVGLKASFLTTTQPQGFSSYVGRVLNEEGFVERGYLFERGGYSIRCIKDTE